MIQDPGECKILKPPIIDPRGGPPRKASSQLRGMQIFAYLTGSRDHVRIITPIKQSDGSLLSWFWLLIGDLDSNTRYIKSLDKQVILNALYCRKKNLVKEYYIFGSSSSLVFCLSNSTVMALSIRINQVR